MHGRGHAYDPECRASRRAHAERFRFLSRPVLVPVHDLCVPEPAAGDAALAHYNRSMTLFTGDPLRMKARIRRFIVRWVALR